MKRTFYIDMDGVLSDLDGKLSEDFGVPLLELRENPTLRSSLIAIRLSRMGADHYLTLPPISLESRRCLMKHLSSLGSVEILTSLGGSGFDRGVGYKGKEGWVRKFYGDLVESGVLSGFNVVSKCVRKAGFGKPGDFLIDDQEENVRGFKASGGSAVLVTGGSFDILQALRDEGL